MLLGKRAYSSFFERVDEASTGHFYLRGIPAMKRENPLSPLTFMFQYTEAGGEKKSD